MTQNPYQPQQTPPPPYQQPPVTAPPPYAAPPGGYPPGQYGQVEKKPAWPTVIGIISLCLAGLGGLMALVNAAMSAIGFGQAQQQQIMANMPDWFGTYQIGGNVFSILMYLVLGIGGFLLLTRRRAGRSLHIAYIVMAVLAAIASSIVMISVMDHISMPGNMPEKARQAFKTIMTVSTFAGVAMMLAYPVFLVIWFARPKVKEHIRSWQK